MNRKPGERKCSAKTICRLRKSLIIRELAFQTVEDEYEVAFDNGFEEVLIRRATDIFAAAERSPVKRSAVPLGGRLVRAEFELRFAGQ